MELTISVSDKAKIILEQKAAAQGQDVKALIEGLVETQASTLDEIFAPVPDTSDFEADMLAFAEGTEKIPPYNGTYSRADIYFDHD
jgi:hypothetical protein